MKHASPRLRRFLRGTALIVALAGVSAARVGGIGVVLGSGSPGSAGYGGHFGAYTAPWKVQSANVGPWSGYSEVAKSGAAKGPVRTWVPGRWSVQRERVWVTGIPRQVWVQAVYATRFNAFGGSVKVLVTPGHYRAVAGPGRWSLRAKKIWVPGHWVL